jgi:hypothetical protein
LIRLLYLFNLKCKKNTSTLNSEHKTGQKEKRIFCVQKECKQCLFSNQI